MPVDPCPLDPEDCAERFCRNEMPEAEAKAFAQHCDACPRCAAVLSQEVFVIRVLRAGRSQEPK